MKITAIQNIRKYTVTATTQPRQYKVVVSSTPKQRIITIAPLGKRGFRGYSVYELAVQNGFPGTEQDWLESLKGKSFQETFETVSKNLKGNPYALNYTSGKLTSIVYTLPNGTITKTLNYTGEKLTSIVLSGDTPSGINLTKTLSYTGDTLTSITYS